VADSLSPAGYLKGSSMSDTGESDLVEARNALGKEPLVHGIVNDNLVLMPEDVANAVAEDLLAIMHLTTYGDARRFEPQFLLVPGLDHDGYDELPADEVLYDVTSTNDCQDSNWPPPAATIALDHLPDDLDDIGEQIEHFPNFPTLYIDPATEADLVEDLTRLGYAVRRDDDLIKRVDPNA
jgi:hypothetical protein